MSDSSPAYERTASGYIRADGERRDCVRFYLTPSQRRQLDAKFFDAAQAHPTGRLTRSEFFVAELGLDEDE